ncbi:MAG: hypothetical protein KGQ59_01070 [Bdellovibrionales bacterium]|nr:hypothetical protein [Bdellovibrionales bacterium]
MKNAVLFCVLGLSLTGSAYARSAPDAEYLIGSDVTIELPTRPSDRLTGGDSTSEESFGEALIVLDRLIVVGEKIWKIVEAGRPVASFSTQRVNVLPYGVSKWQELSGWQTPKSRRFERKIKNKYGADVVTFRYRMVYTYGGNVNGQGAYLMGVSVYPEIIDVAWGWTFDASAAIAAVSNAGTREDPIAAAELLISSRVKTTLTHLENSESYYLRGDGSFVDLQK